MDPVGWRLCHCFEVNAVVRLADWCESQGYGVIQDIFKYAESLGNEWVD